MNNKTLVKLSIFILFGILFINLISAEVSYCCEKTTYGAWCQNDAENKCDNAFQKTPTSCESASFCREGCCYNSQEGNCMQNTPERVCKESSGVWNPVANCDVPQCELGCCLIGDQAAFVTQTRCKRLSSIYGLEINFRKNIGDEVSCIASATSKVKGACVFEKEFERTCLLTTQKECADLEAKENTTEFYENKLCSDEQLATNCGPSEKTTCVSGKDQVYFLDLCGNLANIYDSTKLNDKNYWADMKTSGESCGPTSNNANSRTCGNCDYYLGSTCKQYERGTDAYAPDKGDYLCRDLGCEYEGESYEHGETWCAPSDNTPGSRHFRLLCYNGEVSVEPCADYRQQVCVESELNGFSVGGCVINRWEDCVTQSTQDDCNNTAQRDCTWLDKATVKKVNPDAHNSICVPKDAPGFDFWQSETDAADMCQTATATCVMTYERGILNSQYVGMLNGLGAITGLPTDWKCEENCECDDQSWLDAANGICTSMGDCGSSVNYLNFDGYYSAEDLRDMTREHISKSKMESEVD